MKRTVLTILIVMLMGCGEANEDDGIRLSFWQFWTSPDVKPTVEKLVADFERAHPEMKIDLVDLTWSDGHEKIVVAFSTGSAPDIVELGSDWIGEFAFKGVLADLTPFYDSAAQYLLMWEPSTVGERVYAIPWLLGTRVLYYNRELMVRAGIQADSAPTSWGQLLDYSKRISALGDPFYGFGSNSAERHRLYKKFLPFLWSNGGRVLSDDGAACLLGENEAVNALEFYVSLSDAGYMDTQRGLDDKFLVGELGFIISGDWLLKRIADRIPAFSIGTAKIPSPDEGTGSVSFAGGEFLAVNAESKWKREALEFISYLVSEVPDYDFCRAVGSPTPSNVEASRRILSESDSLSETFLHQIRVARAPPVHPQWVYIEEILEKAIEKAIYHKSDPRSAMEDASLEINKLLAKQLSR